LSGPSSTPRPRATARRRLTRCRHQAVDVGGLGQVTGDIGDTIAKDRGLSKALLGYVRLDEIIDSDRRTVVRQSLDYHDPDRTAAAGNNGVPP
jgi:hypothetical protein